MLFGQRTRGWAEAGRRILGDRNEGSEASAAPLAESDFTEDFSDSPLESAEDDSQEPAMEPDYAVPPESNVDADPTQRLLTVLGRFQRQVQLAESGAPSETWVDACMDQVITGIEIAFECEWDGVKEALTDTARVLQSYDEGGDANGAVQFLLDSYEILCLMVGDLIVDNVRSGVMRKWRERYAEAVQQLESQGHRLVQDDGEPRAVPAPETSPSNITRFQPKTETPLDDPDVEVRDLMGADSDEDDDDDDIPFESPSFQQSEETLEPEMTPAPWDEEEENPYIEEELEQAAAEEETVEETEPAEDGFEYLSEDAEQSAEAEDDPFAESDDAPEAELETAGDAEAEEATEADAYAEAELEERGDLFDSVPSEPEPQLGLFDQLMSEDEEPAKAAAEAEVAETATDVEPPTDEALYAEDPEAETIAEPEPADEPEPEAEALFEEPEAPAEPARPTPEALLRSAQEAMSRGDVADTKLVALRLAADMAILETVKARDQLADAEARLEAADAAIIDAEEQAVECEVMLEETREKRTKREQELGAKRAKVEQAESGVSEVEGVIADIEQQIAELQEKLAAEMERLTTAESELEAEQNDAQIIDEDIRRLQDSEERSAEALEEARANETATREERNERERMRAQREKELERQQASLDGIEATLMAVTGQPEPSGADE